MNSYQKALQERKEQHLLRTLPLPPEGIDFYSNDYLGLAKSEALHKSIETEYGTLQANNGATGSRLLSGNSAYAESVERKVADYHLAESALIYASGYTANLGLISSLATKETTLIMDELVHASLIDGARLGRSQRVRFKHNSAHELEKILKGSTGQNMVIVESVYSMDGDICPLEEVIALCSQYGAMLIVDEAHSMAIYGEKGEGMVQELGLTSSVFARIVTYGKAPGIHGAAVVGPKWLKEYQTNFSRSFIFSTAPTDHHFAAINALYDHLPSIQKEQSDLKEVVSYFLQKRKSHHGSWVKSDSHIQSLIVPGNEEVIQFGIKLREAGINALPIRKPSVPAGEERIRFCLHAYNTQKEIDRLFEIL